MESEAESAVPVGRGAGEAHEGPVRHGRATLVVPRVAPSGVGVHDLGATSADRTGVTNAIHVGHPRWSSISRNVVPGSDGQGISAGAVAASDPDARTSMEDLEIDSNVIDDIGGASGSSWPAPTAA